MDPAFPFRNDRSGDARDSNIRRPSAAVGPVVVQSHPSRAGLRRRVIWSWRPGYRRILTQGLHEHSAQRGVLAHGADSRRSLDGPRHAAHQVDAARRQASQHASRSGAASPHGHVHRQSHIRSLPANSTAPTSGTVTLPHARPQTTPHVHPTAGGRRGQHGREDRRSGRQRLSQATRRVRASWSEPSPHATLRAPSSSASAASRTPRPRGDRAPARPASSPTPACRRTHRAASCSRPSTPRASDPSRDPSWIE